MQKNGLTETKIQSSDKQIFGHFTIISVINKLVPLIYTIDNNTNVLMISETKLGDSIPIAQFQMKVSVFHKNMTEMERAVDFFCTFARINSLDY